jgi:hypothetical protein
LIALDEHVGLERVEPGPVLFGQVHHVFAEGDAQALLTVPDVLVAERPALELQLPRPQVGVGLEVVDDADVGSSRDAGNDEDERGAKEGVPTKSRH